MRMSQMFPSNYLGKDDVPHPLTTTIAKVTQEEIKGDNGNELKAVIYFHGLDKAFICNKTNAFTLCEAYGDDSDLWRSKPVEIYLDPTVSFGGKRVGGLRLRIPAGGGRATPPANGNTPWTFNDAVTAAAPYGITRDSLIAGLKSQGRSGWMPSRDQPFVEQLIRDVQAVRREPGDESFETVPTGGEIPF